MTHLSPPLRPMTAALYARYSSDLQSDRSIADQVALAETCARRDGLIVTHRFEDRALSGASTAQRPGLKALLAAAAQGLFTHLIVESLDRLSRDQGDMAHLYKRLRFHGIEIREVHGGIATPINAAVKGLMGSLFLADLAVKTHRGLAGNIRAGKSAGGRAYGYAPVPGQPGALVIVAHEADVVRRIFADYAKGLSPRAIAAALNSEAVPPILGTRWNASTIHGRKDRGNGILGNALYRGERVWNKVRMLKHPDTGLRISKPNPPSEWHRQPAPELRLIDEETWVKVEARRIVQDPRGHLNRHPKHPLSGLLKCHACGGSLVVKDRQQGKTRLRCSTHSESASCSNNRVYLMQRIEDAVFATLRTELEQPDLITAYVREYNAERRRLANNASKTRNQTQAKLTSVTAEIERIVTLMVKGLVDPERHAARLKQLEAEEKALQQAMAATEKPDVVTLHPQAITRYRQQLDDMRTTLNTPEAPRLASIVKRITLQPDYSFAIEAHLTPFLSPTTTRGGLMVAGEGVEPPTPGL